VKLRETDDGDVISLVGEAFFMFMRPVGYFLQATRYSPDSKGGFLAYAKSFMDSEFLTIEDNYFIEMTGQGIQVKIICSAFNGPLSIDTSRLLAMRQVLRGFDGSCFVYNGILFFHNFEMEFFDKFEDSYKNYYGMLYNNYWKKSNRFRQLSIFDDKCEFYTIICQGCSDWLVFSRKLPIGNKTLKEEFRKEVLSFLNAFGFCNNAAAFFFHINDCDGVRSYLNRRNRPRIVKKHEVPIFAKMQ